MSKKEKKIYAYTHFKININGEEEISCKTISVTNNNYIALISIIYIYILTS